MSATSIAAEGRPVSATWHQPTKCRSIASANVVYEAVVGTLQPNGLAAVALENVQLSYIDE